MILIAENLNSSVPAVYTALAEQEHSYLADLIRRLDQSPADYLDLNAGQFLAAEAEVLCSLIQLVRQHSQKPLMLDSPDPAVLAAACPLAGQNFILNSLTLAQDRFNAVSQLALDYQAGLVALLMHEDRLPQGSAARIELADELVSRLTDLGLPASSIFLDPLISPLSTDDQAALCALETIRALREKFPACPVIIGLSNISFGLPGRKHLNRAFLVQAQNAGLNSAILDTLDADLIGLSRAQHALSGQDEYCLHYLDHYR